MTSSTSRAARTGDDVSRERDELRERTDRLEEALDTIAQEIAHALEHPQIQHLALCRLATLVSRTRERLSLPPEETGVRVRNESGAHPRSKTAG
jgi:hypothetical protein